ncbi:DUF397 domain-containing protein [Actinomadura sp. 21ATH]|uniref:DUF397 domain-containing protein n=1 Tax=Actinomadura sp. 21ATH TaxID=1735444 RepID=UPI0035BF4969
MTSNGLALTWRKGSRSEMQDCVELAGAPGAEVLLRDSKDPSAGMFRFGGAEFAAFVARVKSGELDL